MKTRLKIVCSSPIKIDLRFLTGISHCLLGVVGKICLLQLGEVKYCKDIYFITPDTGKYHELDTPVLPRVRSMSGNMCIQRVIFPGIWVIKCLL